MYCPAFATGFRLLARCLTRTPILPPLPPSPSSLPRSSSSSSLIDSVLKPSPSWTSECLFVNEAIQAGTYEGSLEGTVFKCVVNRTEVECRIQGGVLQARVQKELELVAAKTPLLRSMAHKIIEESAGRDEVDEMMEQVQKMFDELDEMKRARIGTLEVPYDDEDEGVEWNGFESSESRSRSDLGLKSIQVGPYTWLSATKEAEFASQIAKCEMTVEDVDQLLRDLYREMNALVLKHAENSEERRSMAHEAHRKMNEYAEILLDSPCEVRLAVERARVRTVGLRQFKPDDAAYLASLAPGSSHVVGCDHSCVENYLPHRYEVENGLRELEYLGEPELSDCSSSEASTPNEIPSTPRLSTLGLPEEEPVAFIAPEENPEVVPVKTSEKTFALNSMRKTKVVRASVKSAWW